MISNLGTVVAALISWIVFNAIGKPMLRFFDLRTEIRRTMILYDNVRARWRERDKVRVLVVGDEDMTPDNFERLQEAENQYRDLASQVRAFADTQSPTCTILRWFGLDARKASSGLIGLSNTINTYGRTRAFQKQTINEALRFPKE
jgi:hypothetical protein